MMLRSIACAIAAVFVTTIYAADSKVNESGQLTYSEDKLNILVSSKQPSFVLKLKSNPTTGYAWFLREYDAALIMPVKHEFLQAEKKLIGAPGYELWTFKVNPAAFTVPQQTMIRLIYARPWANSDAATQLSFRISTSR